MFERPPQRRLSIRLARDESDLAAVQGLRWQVFFADREAGAHTAPADRFDRDAFDGLCDHLLVIDAETSEASDQGARVADGAVVGTYRLLRESIARAHGGFYTAGEFDIGPLARAGSADGRELLELGRSCVLPAYRTSATISLLWRGIAEYITAHRIGLMFGCASFPGTDPDLYAPALSYLYHHHLAEAGQRPSVLAGKGVPMERLPLGGYDERRAMFQLPPLVKGYMRAGAKFGDGAFIDHEFGTVDVCVVMPVDLIADRYAARFSVAA